MALLTIPAFPEKGTLQEYSLNVTDLIALIADSYFQDQANWSKVVVLYQSSESNQLEVINFIPDGSTELFQDIQFSSFARDLFGIHSITIFDFQNGRYQIRASEIPDVSSYTVVFTTASINGSSLYGVSSANLSGQNSALSFNNADSNELIISSVYKSAFGTAANFETMINLSTGKYDSELSVKLMDSLTDAITFNDDNTVAWMVGRYDTTCCGITIPAAPNNPSVYGSTPQRIVKYDLVENTITVIANVRYYSLSSVILGDHAASLSVDEASDRVVVGLISKYNGGPSNVICGYSISTGNLEYVKNIEIVSSIASVADGVSFGMVKTSGSKFYMFLKSYNGVAQLSGGGAVRINYSTGDIDNTYPQTPANTGSGRVGYFFAVSPDKQKQIVVGADGFYNPFGAFVYVNDSVSSSLNVGNEVRGVTISDTHFFIMNNSGLIKKYDFTGAFVSDVVPSTSWSGFTVPTSFTQMTYNNEAIYVGSEGGASLLKFDLSTGLRVPSFFGAVADSSVGIFGRFEIYSSTLLIGRPYSRSFIYATQAIVYVNTINSNGGAMALYDYSGKTQAGYRSFPSFGTLLQPVGAPPMTSPLFPDLIFIVFSSGSSITVYNVSNPNSWVEETGWPTRTAGNVRASILDGNFIYIVGGADLVFTDSSGPFSSNGQLVRININTKLIDRSFNPSFPNFGGSSFRIFSTAEYLYISSTTGSGAAKLWQMKKSDNSIIQITGSTVGLSGDFGSPLIYVTETQNGLMLYAPNQSNIFLNNRAYMLIDEVTLSQTGTQPPEDTTIPLFVTYNPTLNVLGGIMYSNFNPSSLFLISYNISTGVRSVVSSSLNQGNNSISVNLDANMPVISKDSDFLFFISGEWVYNRKVYSGVVRMNPLGVMNN